MFSLPDDIPAKKAFRPLTELERKTSGSSGRVQGVRTPPPLRCSFRLRIYVLAFKSFLPHRQWRHSLEVYPLLRKILDPRLMACLVGNSTLQTSVTWKGKHPKNDIFIVIMVQLSWKSLWKCLETIKACCNQFRLHKLLCQIEKLSSHFQIMSQCHAYTLKTNKFKIQCLQQFRLNIS